MGLTATITSAVNSLFNALGDLVHDITLHVIDSGSYDPDVGGIVGATTTYTFKGVFDKLQGSTFNNTLVDFESKVCYLKPNSSNPDPTIGNKISGSDGILYTIVDIEPNRPNDTEFVWELLVKL